jgi:hypothetical protein
MVFWTCIGEVPCSNILHYFVFMVYLMTSVFLCFFGFLDDGYVELERIWKEVFLVYWFRARLTPLRTSATNWPIVPAPDDRWWWWMWSSRRNENWQGKPKYSEKLCPSVTLSTNPPWLTWARTRATAVGSTQDSYVHEVPSLNLKACSVVSVCS